jgi:hypothetical protein
MNAFHSLDETWRMKLSNVNENIYSWITFNSQATNFDDFHDRNFIS